jgi:hypothetical protein
MTELQIALSILCGVVAVLLVDLMVLDVLPGRATYSLLVLLELALVAQLVLGLVRVFGDHEGVSVATYVGYLVGALVMIPLAAGWAWAERTRNGTGVLLVAIIVLPVLFVRLNDIWLGHG